jgi:hypothetical protein
VQCSTNCDYYYGGLGFEFDLILDQSVYQGDFRKDYGDSNGQKTVFIRCSVTEIKGNVLGGNADLGGIWLEGGCSSSLVVKDKAFEGNVDN